MKVVELTIPYPPSVNRIYFNRKLNESGLKGRGLTKEGKCYKKAVADLIHYTFPTIKFGKQKVKVSILSKPPNNRSDNHNGLKIVFDAIEMSGLIDNDKQIVSLEIIPDEVTKFPEWIIRISPYTLADNLRDIGRFLSERLMGAPNEC